MSNITKLLDRLSINEWYTESYLEGVYFFKSSKSVPRAPLFYKSRIIIVWEGTKIGYLDGKTIQYNKDNYLVLSVPMAFECETIVEKDKKFLALIIDIDFKILNEIVQNLWEHNIFSENMEKKWVESVKMEPALKDSVCKLLKTLESKEESKILWSNTLREILYRVLKGKHWVSLFALYDTNARFSKLAKILNEINKNYSENYYVKDLAKSMWMSEAAFFRYFKSVTGFPPIQYIKNIKLQKAKELLISENLLLKEVAKKIWYKSIPQFSREFKRYFDVSPKSLNK